MQLCVGVAFDELWRRDRRHLRTILFRWLMSALGRNPLPVVREYATEKNLQHRSTPAGEIDHSLGIALTNEGALSSQSDADAGEWSVEAPRLGFARIYAVVHCTEEEVGAIAETNLRVGKIE
jgi:hypothetical protein